ncbi:MAG: hypothetical protein E7453_06825 [Ruminococcaceae bacterium]|nr:hypothetical protein [Oscillospiraceae bacterium]
MKQHPILRFLLQLILLTLAYFSAELIVALFVETKTLLPYAFGFLWSMLFAAVALLLPRKIGRIFFLVTFFLSGAYALAQAAHFDMFRKLTFFTSVYYVGEGAKFFMDILRSFPLLWWPCVAAVIAILILGARFFPKRAKPLPAAITAVLCVFLLVLFPQLFIVGDEETETTYAAMYDAEAVYSVTGYYHMTARDLWCNVLFPDLDEAGQTQQLNRYFADRKPHTPNEMTGIYRDKNVVYVLLEAIDDWVITPENTPTMYRLMNEGISFTNFYSPGFGSARTLSSELCINTGIYLPTSVGSLFDYDENQFPQSIANQAVKNGYSAEVFHYNDPAFYSRGTFEPLWGYGDYHGYCEYTDDESLLYDECTPFTVPELSDIFFREGKTFNTIITRSAHLSYDYSEPLSIYALSKYPEYRGKYGSEEEDCLRVKARLVDDMFTMLLSELEKRGLLEDTVIVAVTDHYAYGYNDQQELRTLSGVEHELLLEKTPCFIWSADKPQIKVDKPVFTADVVPTMLNLLGIDSPYRYLGNDAFDPTYDGCVYFPDGSWIADGIIAFRSSSTATYDILANEKNLPLTEEYLRKMQQKAEAFIVANNALLPCDYYKTVR